MLSLYRKLAVLALAAISLSSYAQVVNLVDGASNASINAGGNGTPGLVEWRMGGGPNQVVQQVYAYRIGEGPVQVVNTISAPNIDQPTGYLANISYTSAENSFLLKFRYLLTDGFPNSSDLAEVTTLFNRGNSALNFTLYEYDFFTPGGIFGGTGQLLNSSTIQQTNEGGSITVGATGIPNHWMIDTTSNVVNAILGGTLTDSQSTFTNSDLGFAFQWNVAVAPGGSWQMSKDKLLAVPEPASLLALGGLSLIAIRRRRARK